MGIPSFPLLATLRAEPKARGLLEALWRPHRAASKGSEPEPPDHGSRDDAYAELVALVKVHGIPATVDKVMEDAALVVREAPGHAKPSMRQYAYSMVDRLRGLDARARIEAHI